MCPIPLAPLNEFYVPPLPSTDPGCYNVVEEDRGRSRSRSPNPVRVVRCYTPRSRSRSSSRSRSPSLFIPPPSPYPAPICQLGPTPVASPPSWVPPPSWYAAPPSGGWPIQGLGQPVDILTLKYNEHMAYVPATKTYDEAIDIVLELWPELRDVERDQIRFLVLGPGHLVRVPRMTWSAILCDVPRYEVVHVQVEQVPPPPQYQGKGKGKWGNDDEKGRRSSGLFSSIRRIFG